jgi:hypothetical protein
MADYYVDSINGDPGNGGTSWADALDALNDAEDLPVSAGDTVHCRGVFREQLTWDVSGTPGNEISYVGYRHPDTGLSCRITGSDDDETITRSYCVYADGIDYRILQRFVIDTSSGSNIYLDTGCISVTIADCVFQMSGDNHILIADAGQSGIVIQRCVFLGINYNDSGISLTDSAGTANGGHTIENCQFFGDGTAITSSEVGGITVRNNLFSGCYRAVRVSTALPGGYTAITVNNCALHGGRYGLVAVNVGEIVENYNNFWQCATSLSNVNAGANSVAYPTLLALPGLVDGVEPPWFLGKLSSWSALGSIAGTGVASDDLFGFTRSGTSSWGPIEYAAARDDALHERYLAAQVGMQGGMDG